MHQAIHALAHLIDDHAMAAGMSARFAATKLVEGDEPTLQALKLNANELDIVDHIVPRNGAGAAALDREAAMADMRYTFIEGLCHETVVKPQVSKEQLRSRKVRFHPVGALYWLFPSSSALWHSSFTSPSGRSALSFPT